MFGSDALTYFWQAWVGFFASLNLPWDSRTSAYAGLFVMFYLIGLAFKHLISPSGR